MSPLSRGFQGRRRAEGDSAGVPRRQYVTYDFPDVSAELSCQGGQAWLADA